MNDPQMWVLAGLAGIAIGAMFFGGLWWTVGKSMSASAPALWVLGSLLVRTGVALAGFFYVAGGQWQRWIACLSGLVVARFVVTALTRPTHSPEANHGS